MKKATRLVYQSCSAANETFPDTMPRTKVLLVRAFYWNELHEATANDFAYDPASAASVLLLMTKCFTARVGINFTV